MIMDSVKGYKTRFEIKDKNLYCRMDSGMIQRLKEIRKATGISVSEVIRESVRRLIQEVDDTDSINLRVN
jgi:predicted DNA-binding protein